ncbi:MAG: hypothetical protein GY716_03360 [bacterium]|nr:hypothetical protein [bacterium]
MTPRTRWTMILIAIVGTGVCSSAVISFILTIFNNELPVEPGGGSLQAQYLAVGQTYSQGFTVGFFLCLFLSLVAIAIGSWTDSRRAARLSDQT